MTLVADSDKSRINCGEPRSLKARKHWRNSEFDAASLTPAS